MITTRITVKTIHFVAVYRTFVHRRWFFRFDIRLRFDDRFQITHCMVVRIFGDIIRIDIVVIITANIMVTAVAIVIAGIECVQIVVEWFLLAKFHILSTAVDGFFGCFCLLDCA